MNTIRLHNSTLPAPITGLRNLPIHYSNHALNASKTDRYGDLPIVNKLPDEYEVFEVEVIEISYRPVKYGIRFSIGNGLDMVMILLIESNRYIAKTVWFNKTDDTHNTLDLSKYGTYQPYADRQKA